MSFFFHDLNRLKTLSPYDLLTVLVIPSELNLLNDLIFNFCISPVGFNTKRRLLTFVLTVRFYNFEKLNFNLTFFTNLSIFTFNNPQNHATSHGMHSDLRNGSNDLEQIWYGEVLGGNHPPRLWGNLF